LERPVLATNVGGIPEIIDDGVTGVLITSDNPLILADSIVKLMADSDFRQKLGTSGREKVVSAFNVGKIADQYTQYYTDLLTGNKLI
jgi:glycosyltransferase involved in cell wall biosynthesis